jgi:hypothetical protein
MEKAFTKRMRTDRFVMLHRCDMNNNPEMPYRARRPSGKQSNAFRNVSAEASRILNKARPGAIVGRRTTNITSHIHPCSFMHHIKFMHELLEVNLFFTSCGVVRT